MHTRLPIVTATAISAVLSLPVFAASFNARPGAWEMVLSTTIAGNPIPPETMAKMTPEKRALVEEALKARVSKPIAATYKVCISQEELDDANIVRSGTDDHNCTRKTLSRSATRLVIEQICPAPASTLVRMTIEAPTPEKLIATIDLERTESTSRTHMDIAGRWLGTGCASIEEEGN